MKVVDNWQPQIGDKVLVIYSNPLVRRAGVLSNRVQERIDKHIIGCVERIQFIERWQANEYLVRFEDTPDWFFAHELEIVHVV